MRHYTITTKDSKGSPSSHSATGDDLSIIADGTEFGSLIVVTLKKKTVLALPAWSFVKATSQPVQKKKAPAKLIKLASKRG
jgi:hypothetical protein